MYPLIFVLVFVRVYISQGRSLYDIESQNMTGSFVDIPTGKDSDILRQLLNQETIIRMSMVKNIHLLIQDVVTLKEDMVSMQEKVDSLERQSEKLTNENKRLTGENIDLKKQLDSVNISISEQVDIVNISLVQVKNKLSESELIFEEKRETFERNISGILGDIKIEVRYLSITLLSLNDNTRELNKSIPARLEENNRSLFDFINRTYDKLTEDITKSNDRHVEMVSSLSDLRTVQNNLTKLVTDDMNIKMIDLQENVQKWKQDQTKLSLSVTSLELSHVKQKVAFTVGVTSQSSSWSGSTLVFTRIIYDIGGGYSTSTGIFTSLTDGTFVFYISVQSYNNQNLQMDIVLNGNSIVRGMAWHSSTNIYQTGTNMVVLNIQKGDRVWVKRHAGTGYYTHDTPITTFSGFRIY